MSITFAVLGERSRDNALLVTVDTGQKQTKLLFDCGDGCLSGLGFGTIQSIDALFFSHLHMDHIGGFDTYFRCNFDRVTMPNLIWGPKKTGSILQHRFQGFIWNLTEGKTGSWTVRDIEEETISAVRFELREAFSMHHDEGITPFNGIALTTPEFTVEAFIMDHGTDSIAYLVKEAPRLNINTEKLSTLGLKPGSWMQALKSPDANEENVEIGGKSVALSKLRRELLVETPGDSIAYLTDFYIDERAIARFAPCLRGCQTLVCEAQYRHADLQLAIKNRHMTATNVAKLAKEAGVASLVLFHVSERYNRDEQEELLAEAQETFPNTAFPEHWS